jgi:hypothetical protein
MMSIMSINFSHLEKKLLRFSPICDRTSSSHRSSLFTAPETKLKSPPMQHQKLTLNAIQYLTFQCRIFASEKVLNLKMKNRKKKH